MVSEDFLGVKLQLPGLTNRDLCNDAGDRRWFALSLVDLSGKWMMIATASIEEMRCLFS